MSTLTWWQLARAVLVGAVFALLTLTIGFEDFVAKRTKLVRESKPAVERVVSVDARGVFEPAAAGSPLALVARLSNQTRDRQYFDVGVGADPGCRVAVDAQSTKRIDCIIVGGSASEITIRSSAADWSLDYLEIATHFGSSRSPARLFVLPHDRSVDPPGLIWITAIASFGIALVFVPAVRPQRRWTRIVWGTATTLLAVCVVAVILAPLLTQYRVVVSVWTVLRLVAVCFAFRIWFLVRWVSGRIAGSPLLRHIAVGAVVLVLFGGVLSGRLREYDYNYSGFLLLSSELYDLNPILNKRPEIRSTLMLRPSGFDAQFMYFAVFDPFLLELGDKPQGYRRFVDYPPYRYGRIGFSLLTKAVSLDQWRWYPVTMVWLILLSLVATAICLSRFARDAGLHEAWGSVVLLIPGYWVSLQSGLPEPVASACLIGGYLALRHLRFAAAGVLFGASLLTRETGIVFVALVLAWQLLVGQRRGVLMTATIGLGSVALWRLYVGVVLYPDWGLAGFVPNPEDIGIPFSGFVGMWSAIRHGAYGQELFIAAVWLPLVITAALLLSVVLAFRTPSPVTFAAVVYGLVAVSLNYEKIWVHVGNGQRGTYEVFLMLALASVDERLSRGLRISIGAFWVLAASYVFVGAYDAGFIRDSMRIGF